MARLPPRQRCRGSALWVALIVAFVVAVILAGLAQWSANERATTIRHVALAKTRMMAESVDEYGAAQIKARLERLTYFADDEFRPGNNPPTMDVASIVSELLATRSGGGIGQSLSALLRAPAAGSGGDSTPDETADSGFFRYEITPEDFVVGRFGPARWEKADAGNPLYTGDPLVDQVVRVREVRMLSSAKAVDRLRGSTLWAYCESYLQVRDSPVWGNALLYNMDLEIAPGPPMEIHGPVHTNGNFFVQSGEALQFHDIVTAAGRLYHGRAPRGVADAGGQVRFRKDGTDSEFVSLQQGGDWLDSRTPDWAARASTLWAGNVRTKEHGINPATPAGVAPYTPDDPATPGNEWQNPAHVLIEPATPSHLPTYPGDSVEIQKLASQACLVLEVSPAGSLSLYKYEPSASGSFVRDVGLGAQTYVRRQLSVPADLVVGGSAADRFFDKRRGQWVNSVDLDVGRLKSLIEVSGRAAELTRGAVTFDPATEWNGIVYVAHAQTSRSGVRLVNGASIPSRPTSANGNTAGFTLATNAPLYVRGNYNANGQIPSDGSLIREPDSSSEPPAGLAADAVTILSNAWSDANSDKDLSQRRAQQTEVAAALLTGLVPTNKNNNGAYSGGVENLPRFLENWSGVKFGYRGSMVVLYESERATEPWGGSNVYSAPNRVWGFNSLFARGFLPPGTPNSRTYRRIGFRDLSQPDYEAALTAVGQE